MDTNELIRLLRPTLEHQGGSDVKQFEEVLTLVAAQHDPGCIGPLVELFDDNAEYDELMFSIVHTIEKFDDAVYVRELLAVAPALCRRAPRWASIVIMRVLNLDSVRAQLVLQLEKAPVETKVAIRWLMDRINECSPEFLEKTVPVLVAVR